MCPTVLGKGGACAVTPPTLWTDHHSRYFWVLASHDSVVLSPSCWTPHVPACVCPKAVPPRVCSGRAVPLRWSWHSSRPALPPRPLKSQTRYLASFQPRSGRTERMLAPFLRCGVSWGSHGLDMGSTGHSGGPEHMFCTLLLLYTHTGTPTYTHAHTYAHMCVNIHAHTCVHTISYMHMQIHVCTHIQVYAHVNAR